MEPYIIPKIDTERVGFLEKTERSRTVVSITSISNQCVLAITSLLKILFVDASSKMEWISNQTLENLKRLTRLILLPPSYLVALGYHKSLPCELHFHPYKRATGPELSETAYIMIIV